MKTNSICLFFALFLVSNVLFAQRKEAVSISLDEMVFGSQAGRKEDKEAWEQIIADCTRYEKEILRDTAKTLKASLREHSSIRTEENVI